MALPRARIRTRNNVASIPSLTVPISSIDFPGDLRETHPNSFPTFLRREEGWNALAKRRSINTRKRGITETAPLTLNSLPCADCREECLSEMLGTYMLVLLGPGSIVVASLLPFLSPTEALFAVALTFGSTVASVILLLGGRSGAHINPAVTIANTVSGLFKRNLFVPYLTFQLVGGLLAGLTLRLVFGAMSGSGAALGSTELSASATQLEGFSLEVLGTFVLAFSALSASVFVSGRLKQAALVGSTLFFLILLIGPITGASFNPARSLGPSIFSGYYTDQIIYWIGPTLGAVLAGVVFRSFRTRIGAGGDNVKNIDIVCVC